MDHSVADSDADAHRGRSLEKHPDQQVLRRRHPVAGAARMSLIGGKSCGERPSAAPRRVASVQGFPSAPSRRRGALGRCRHAAEGDAGFGDHAAVHPIEMAAQHGRDVLVEAFGDLVDPETRALAQLAARSPPRRTRRAAVLLAVGEEVVLQRHVRRSLAAAQHQRRRRPRSGPAGMSPIGEPLAMLPQMVPRLRTCNAAEASQQFAELGMQFAERRLRVGVCDARADSRARRPVLDARSSATSLIEMTVGRSRCCLVTHSPTSVPPARIVASGLLDRPANSASVRGARSGGPCARSRGLAVLQACELRAAGRRRRARSSPVPRDRLAGREDRAVAGAAAEVSGERVLHRALRRSALALR